MELSAWFRQQTAKSSQSCARRNHDKQENHLTVYRATLASGGSGVYKEIEVRAGKAARTIVRDRNADPFLFFWVGWL
jgi:hypothetical protein